PWQGVQCTPDVYCATTCCEVAGDVTCDVAQCQGVVFECDDQDDCGGAGSDCCIDGDGTVCRPAGTCGDRNEVCKNPSTCTDDDDTQCTTQGGKPFPICREGNDDLSASGAPARGRSS
ncbi:MAG: hypothetical protein AAGC55_23425, partial [Myxococcota bacterium]